MAASAATAPTASSQNPVVANAMARAGLIPGPSTQTVRRFQQIAQFTSANYIAGQQLRFTAYPAPAGIITRFLVRVSASVGIGGAETQTRVGVGAAAFFSNVQYVDTSNQTRINVPGWYLNILSTQRRRREYAAALVGDVAGVAGSGDTWGGDLISAPATLNAGPPAAGSPNFAMVYELPLAYGHDDLRGGVLANLINASQSIILTVNPNFFAAAGDEVNVAEAAYQSSTAQLGAIGNLTITVYQEYIDQIGGLPLPMIDLATQYLLQTHGGERPVANTDLIIPYSNYRLFLSTIIRYNNSGVFNLGSDMNYIAVRTANGTDLIHVDPYILTLLNREQTGCDLPAGYYAINHRAKPLFTNSFGNISLVIQAGAVTGVNSSVTVGYEQLALMSQVAGAGGIGG